MYVYIYDMGTPDHIFSQFSINVPYIFLGEKPHLWDLWMPFQQHRGRLQTSFPQTWLYGITAVDGINLQETMAVWNRENFMAERVPIKIESGTTYRPHVLSKNRSLSLILFWKSGSFGTSRPRFNTSKHLLLRSTK